MQISHLAETEYHSYYQPYIRALGEVELLPTLKNGKTVLSEFISSVPDSKKNFSYEVVSGPLLKYCSMLSTPKGYFNMGLAIFKRG